MRKMSMRELTKRLRDDSYDDGVTAMINALATFGWPVSAIQVVEAGIGLIKHSDARKMAEQVLEKLRANN